MSRTLGPPPTHEPPGCRERRSLPAGRVRAGPARGTRHLAPGPAARDAAGALHARPRARHPERAAPPPGPRLGDARRLGPRPRVRTVLGQPRAFLRVHPALWVARRPAGRGRTPPRGTLAAHRP